MHVTEVHPLLSLPGEPRRQQNGTEQIGLEVTVQTRPDTGYPDYGFRGFSQPHQANAAKLSRLDHQLFLPNPF
jgi:hypothetical protein